MATGFSFQIDSRDVQAVAVALQGAPKRIPQLLSRAINRALPPTRKSITAGLKEATTIRKKSRIIKDIFTTKAVPTRLTGEITFKGRAIGAIEFEHKERYPVGVTVRFQKSDGLLRFRHAFKGVGAGGNKHIFSRIPGRFYKVDAKANYKPNIGRRTERLQTIYGPSLRTVYQRNPKIDADAKLAADAAVKKAIGDGIKFILGKGAV